MLYFNISYHLRKPAQKVQEMMLKTVLSLGLVLKSFLFIGLGIVMCEI